MKSKNLFTILLSIQVLLSVFLAMANAQMPGTINYQGYLTDARGSPLDGKVDMSFNKRTTAAYIGDQSLVILIIRNEK